MSCDLHIHSTCSDGAVPIERLASIAARTGLHAIALSDHDTLLSAQYAYAHTGQDGVELIPAVEPAMTLIGSIGCTCCATTRTWTARRCGSIAPS
jgi:predicted metal-dependent phosphoesterase TrpH